MSISPTLLRSLVDYDPKTGAFVWRVRAIDVCVSAKDMKRWNSRFAGKPAFITKDADGYLVGVVMGKTIKAHRAAWAIAKGEWPERDLDHENCVKTDNRIDNLRVATHGENICNMPVRSDNSSGFKGVHWNRGERKWQAQIVLDGKKKYLGRFDDPAMAAAAYDRAAAELHGAFARLNRAA